MIDSATSETGIVNAELSKRIRDANQPLSSERPKASATIIPFPVKRQCGLGSFVSKAFSESYHMTEDQAFVHFQKCAAAYVDGLLAIGVERQRVDVELRYLLAMINATFTKELTVHGVEKMRRSARAI